MAWLRTRPAPYPVTLGILLALECLLLQILGWMTGWLAFLQFDPIILLFPIWLWGTVGIMIHLNAVARAALLEFRPLLPLDDAAFRQLEYEFTTMPAGQVRASSALWAIVYMGLNYVSWDSYAAYGMSPAFVPIIAAAGLASFATGSAIYYHSVRQLRLVNHTVRLAPQFNLFRLNPVYAFSRLTARTGIAWMILLSLTLMLFPIRLTNGPILAVLFTQVGLAGAAFALPLWFVHQRLVAEKRRLLAEHDQRFETLLEDLHRRVDGRQLAGLDQLTVALAGLQAEREILLRIPTWPWRGGTLTSFLSAVGLPIVIFILQLGIEAWVGWRGQ